MCSLKFMRKIFLHLKWIGMFAYDLIFHYIRFIKLILFLLHPFGKVRHNISLPLNNFPSNQSGHRKEMFRQSEAKLPTTKPADRLAGRQRQPVCGAWSNWAHVTSLSMELKMQDSRGFAFGSTPLTLRRKLMNYQLPWPGQGGAGFFSVDLADISCL